MIDDWKKTGQSVSYEFSTLVEEGHPIPHSEQQNQPGPLVLRLSIDDACDVEFPQDSVQNVWKLAEDEDFPEPQR